MTCWKCGRDFPLAAAQKLATRETCPQCDADLHVCRNCVHFDPVSRNECREVMAEPVRTKDRVNYCDYFSPQTAAAAAPARAPRGNPAARSKFDQLFKKS